MNNVLMHDRNYYAGFLLCKWTVFMVFNKPTVEMKLHIGKIPCGELKYNVVKWKQNPEMNKLLI